MIRNTLYLGNRPGRWSGAARAAALLLAAAAASAAGSRGAPAGEAACQQVRLEFYGGLPLTQVRVNGAEPAWFLLDTASSFTFLNAPVAKALGLVTGGGMTISGGNGAAAAITFAEDVTFDVGGVQVRSRAAVLPLGMKYDRPLAGILGAPFYREFTTRMDYAASTLDLCDPARFTPPRQAEAVSFRIEEEIPLIEVGLTLPGREEIVAPVFVDTGASQAVVLNQPFVAEHRLEDGQALEERQAGSLTGAMTYKVARGASVHLGTKVHTGITVGFSPSQRTNRAGVIGNAILRDYILVLDYRRRSMYLEAPAVPGPRRKS